MNRAASGCDIHIKLCDFGYAFQFTDETKELVSMTGSLYYMAPEVIRRNSYGCSVDVWSATVVIFALMTGELPFFCESRRNLMDQILNKDIEYLLSEYDLSDDAISFLISGLQRDPKSRYTCRQLHDHEWLRDDQ